MPGLRDLGIGFWRMWRVLDWRPIRREAETPVRLALLGEGPELDRIAAMFSTAETVRGPVELHVDDPPPDLVILEPPAEQDALENAFRQARELDDRNVASLLLLPPGTEAGAPDTPHMVVSAHEAPHEDRLTVALIEALPLDRRLGAARMAEPLRAPLARQLVLESAFANAQFALMTNLPAFLPGAGTAAALAADMLVLTTNQVVLVYKMAAVWGADLSNPRALLVEAAPVVGGAFLWRGAARTLIGLLPGFAALAPKVGVAYVGTYIVGELANQYYQRGVRPSDARMREIEAEAREALGRIWHRLRPSQSPEPIRAPSTPSALPAGATSPPTALPPPSPTPGPATTGEATGMR
jgi:uncharacterized protein (DUF697 family)